MKRRDKNTIKFLSFVLLFAAFFVPVSRMVTPERVGDVSWAEFYALPKNTVDVLVVGSSKVNHTYNPVLISGALNLDSYCLTGHAMRTDEVYAVMKEAFKTQSPKVVAMEVYSTVPVDEEIYDTAELHRVFDGMRFSPNKAAAILRKVPVKDSLEYFIPFTINHTEWRNWKPADLKRIFLPKTEADRFFGYYAVDRCLTEAEFAELNTKPLPDAGTMEPEAETVAALDKITALCRKNGAKLVFVVSPDNSGEWFSHTQLVRLINGMSGYAGQNGIPLINYNAMLYAGAFDHTDFADPSHTSMRGARKVSQAFAGDLQRLFPDELEDTRQDIDMTEKKAAYEALEKAFDAELGLP